MDQDRSRNASLDESQGEKPRRPKPRDEFEGMLIGERYTLRRRIGEGGFGAVYEAVDERFDSPVAVKLLFDYSHESEITFRKEAKLIRRFKHPHVVEVYDYGVDDGIAYIVMEYLNGTPLHKFFERCGRRLPAQTIRKFVKEIGSALENAHAKNLVHRDLKPQNVMLVDEGQASERFVLLDLGMATKTDAARDETIGNPMANSGLTPQYAPPEQFRQHAATHLSDIYSFGTILYHLLSGRLPFPHAGTLGQLWHAVEHDPPPPFVEIAADRAVPAEVEAVVRRCLEKKPEHRPQSMRELREAFLKALDPSGTLDFSGSTPTIALSGDITDPRSYPTHKQSDILSGVRGASGSATMPVTGMVTVPTAVPGMEPARRGVRRMIWITAVLLLAAAAALGLGFLNRSGAEPETVRISLTPPERPWVATLGRSMTFELPYQQTSGSSMPIRFMVEDLPEHVTADVAGTTAGRLTITITAAPAAAPVDTRIQVVARAGEHQVTQDIPLRLVWMPPEPVFEPAAQGGPAPDALTGDTAKGAAGIVTSRRTGWNFYERLNRVLADGTRVPFVLVLDDSSRDSRPAPFYMLENKVWNGLYEAFAADNADEADLSAAWKDAAGPADPEPGDPRWTHLPVVNVSALEALKFAKWLAGERGHLPRLEQWRTAAGFYEYDLETGRFPDERWAAWQSGPFRGDRVAVGEFAKGNRLPLVLGDADAKTVAGLPIDDVSPRYFVRDMAGNGAEWTSDLAPPPARLDAAASDSDLVFLTGCSYLANQPLTYRDLEDPLGAAILECGSAESTIGFRVVLEPPY